MAIKPIPFTTPMVRALLREIKAPGTGKTQTRRRIGRLRKFGTVTEFAPSRTPGYDWEFRDQRQRWNDISHSMLLAALPYQVGDWLYVREALERANIKAIGYPADRSWLPNTPWIWERSSLPSIHMPRSLSRITLIVTNVRVMRLQEISEADAIAEGVTRLAVAHGPNHFSVDLGAYSFNQPSAGACFYRLWDHLHGEGAWMREGIVAAYTFKVIAGNIDTMGRKP